MEHNNPNSTVWQLPTLLSKQRTVNNRHTVHTLFLSCATAHKHRQDSLEFVRSCRHTIVQLLHASTCFGAKAVAQLHAAAVVTHDGLLLCGLCEAPDCTSQQAMPKESAKPCGRNLFSNAHSKNSSEEVADGVCVSAVLLRLLHDAPP